MKVITGIFLLFLSVLSSLAQAPNNEPLSQKLAETAMKRIWTDDGNPAGIPRKWTYDQGVILKGIEALWYATGDVKYFNHLKTGMDFWLEKDDSIKGYEVDEYNIDHVTPGRAMLTLYRVTGDEKYKKAVDLLRSQLKTHPRTKEGGFWHKKIYPSQMWLDGLYMGEPFYAEYSALFGEDNFEDIANQFVWMENHARDDKTGLLYHGWDESKQQKWADKTTGRSPHFWGRAMGWYAMALVDVLDSFPKNHPRRAEIVAILNREAAAIEKFQDREGLWWQILDKANTPKNYHESSAAAMFVYALAKGVRQGNLPEKYLAVAEKGWTGIKREFIETTPDGKTDWKGTVSVAGLGGNPYRDGSYDYYMSEKVIVNDPKGLGAAIQAAVEMEMLENPRIGKGKTVVLDSYFNNEWKKDANGKMISWHYKWDEMANGGFYLWGKTFNGYGAQTETLLQTPTVANLKNADVYIIVDPDTEKETEKPNFVSAADAKAIAAWVKAGGVLVLMGNDSGNAEFDNFNVLAKQFGIEFNKDSKYRVQNNNFVEGRITVSADNQIFKTGKTLYLKEVSTLNVATPAKSVLEANGDKIMATAKYGKGTVFAVGDPWLYNEYTDGRKLPAEYQNFQAAQDLSAWLLGQARRKK
jgi:unsaturated rhamnogalacturonyl hydrolase